MSSDAPNDNAEQWHIPPQSGGVLSKRDELDSDEARRQLQAHQAQQLDTAIGKRIGEGMTTGPAPGPFVDLQPLILHFERELQRTRDQLSVERTAASSAREALAKCEERARMLTTQLELGRLALDHAKRSESAADSDYKALLAQKQAEWDEQVRRYVLQIKGLEKRAQKAEDKAGRANCERDAALERLTKERANFEGTLDELRWSATEQTVQLVPGTPLAIIEAYRLLVGHAPHLQPKNSMGRPEWVYGPDGALPSPKLAQIYRAAHELLKWLDEHAPGGVK